MKQQRIATSCIFLATGLGVGGWAASIPLVKERLQLSDAQLGQALLAFSIGAIGAMLLTGKLSARFDAWRLTLVAALLCSAVRVGPTLAPDFASLVVVLFLIGAANGVTDVLMNSYASLVDNAHDHPIMSSFHAMWSVGGLCGAALAGALIHAGLGDAVCVGIPAAISVVLVLFGGMRDASLPPAKATPATTTAKAGFQKPQLALLALGVASFFCMLTEGAVGDWSAVYMRQYAGASVAMAASGYAVNALAMATCRFWGDRLVGYLGPARALAVGCAVALLGLLSLLGWPGLVTSLIGFALIGAGIANAVPVLFKAATDKGVSAAAGVSVVATMGYAGYLVGPFTIGLCSQLLGLRSALALLVLAVLVVGLIGSRHVARRRLGGLALGGAA